MGTAFIDKDDTVVSLGDYKPWGFHRAEGGDGSNYPAHSGYVLDVKDNKEAGLRYFAQMLDPLLRTGIVIVTVPSHDPAKTGGGLAALAARLSADGKRTNGTGILVRTAKIQKLAHGGARAVEVHLASVAVEDDSLIRGRDILLLDDVKKTGHSLEACRRLLLQAGANSVQCAALGSTWG